jgi:transposase
MKKEDFKYDMDKHEKFFYAQLSEQQRRLFAALKAMEIGYYGVKEVSEKFNISIQTVRRGKKELLLQTVPPAKKIRRKGGGRKKKLGSYPICLMCCCLCYARIRLAIQ